MSHGYHCFQCLLTVFLFSRLLRHTGTVVDVLLRPINIGSTYIVVVIITIIIIVIIIIIIFIIVITIIIIVSLHAFDDKNLWGCNIYITVVISEMLYYPENFIM